MVVDLDLFQMVFKLSTEEQDGNVYPKIEISDVAITIDPKTFLIKAKGDLPLYKQHQFEEGVKKWMQS